MTNSKKVKYLIIGNSAGGIGATEAIREVDERGIIAIVSDEPYPAYSRPLISEYLAQNYPLDRMLFRPADFYEKNNIQTFLGRKVEKLDTKVHTIRLDDGGTIKWEKLLLATGGLPIIPPIKGRGRDGVFTFITLDDARAIDRYLSRVSRAAVIGGGLIGVSVTEALVKRNINVTVVETKEQLLNTILDEEASSLSEATLKQAGVNIITNHTVAEISGQSPSGAVSSVTLDNGETIPVEMVVIAIGVKPRLELAAGDGIKTNQGIVVNRAMATSNPDVYACGDVAEAYDFIHGENRLTPIWPNAYLGGRVAGFNMAGTRTEYQGGTAMNSLKYFGLAIVSAGRVSPPDDSYQVIRSRANHNYKKVILKKNIITGMVFAEDIERSGIVYNLMKERVNVAGFKDALVADDFSLASLPEEIWRGKVEIPPAAKITLVEAVEEIEEPVTEG